jgi:hypothetical protein
VHHVHAVAGHHGHGALRDDPGAPAAAARPMPSARALRRLACGSRSCCTSFVPVGIVLAADYWLGPGALRDDPGTLQCTQPPVPPGRARGAARDRCCSIGRRRVGHWTIASPIPSLLPPPAPPLPPPHSFTHSRTRLHSRSKREHVLKGKGRKPEGLTWIAQPYCKSPTPPVTVGNRAHCPWLSRPQLSPPPRVPLAGRAEPPD